MSDIVTALRAMGLAPCSEAADELERKSGAIQRLWKERDELREEVERLRNAVVVKTTHIANLNDEIERLRADADRYRFLRDYKLRALELFRHYGDGEQNQLNDAIDAAMKETP